MSTSLDETVPLVIRTEAEYQRLLRAAADFMETPEEAISEEHGRLLEWLGVVIEEYEDRVHPLPRNPAHNPGV